jgi:Ca2+-binding EF-hand superfamily protein
MKEDNNLRKRVFDIRKFKKAFEEKCKDRNNFIQKTNFTDIA